MRKITVIAFMLFLLAGLAAAQLPASGNIFVGYSLENATSSALSVANLSRPNLQGWEASLEGKISPWAGIVADFSGHYGSENYTEVTPEGLIPAKATGHEHEVMFGLRFSVPVAKFTPFGEAMVGVAHMSVGGAALNPSDTSIATALGGGVDYRIIRPFALRLEGDYVTTRFFSSTQNNLRLSAGVVFRF